MLHLGQDDEVSGLEIRARPGIGNEIDRLGRIARVNDLPRGWCIDEFSDLLACSFIHGGGFFSKGVHTTMDVGIRAAIIFIHRFDDRKRFLRCRRGIKINQRNTVRGFTLEDGKVFADYVYIEGHE